MSNPTETYNFDVLYGKSKDSKIKSWKISVERYDDYSEIIILHGYNRKIETRRRINSGKNLNKSNATTHFQQAMLEANSKWTKKKTIENYSVIYPEQTQQQTQEPVISLENLTLKEQIAFPMLAQDYSRHKKKVLFPCFIQPKLDGYRMIYNTTSKSITTRQGKEFSIVKESNLLYKELCSLPEGFILDGELYVHNSPEDSNKVSFETLGVLRKTKNLTKQDILNLNKIQYHVYDIIDTKLQYHNRKTQLSKLIDDKNFTMIKNVMTFQVNSDEEIQHYHEKFVNIQNYEGTMIRNYNGMYKEKYRSYDLLKFKDFMDSEFEIVDYTFEKDTSGADKNLIVWIIKIKDDIICKVRPKGTKEQRQDLYEQCMQDFSKFKGRKLWTKFFEYTSDNNLRFPTTKTTDVSSYIRDEII
jgi:ATP-dependent DNA ligase